MPKLPAMKIVAMECSGATAQLVALEIWGDRAQIAGNSQISEPRGLSRLLMERFDAVLRESGWRMDELDGLAIGIGPGSWTSLRVGISAFKTLALALKIPLAGVPTFGAIASAAYRAKIGELPRRKKSKNLGFDSQIALVLSPCRPGEFYGKVFEMGADFVAPSQSEWIADAKTHVDAAYCQALASEVAPPLLLAGDSAEEAGRHLEARGESYEIAEVDIESLVLEIALAGAAQIAGGEGASPLEVAPLYLAPSNAERVWAQKSGGVLSS
jgi:tRNA threonylcarbamoyl adenosine modification protein YeaZ